jgi:hypothetical protein
MNIINAAFIRNGVTIRTLPVYQYDSGMILQISGLDDLPSTFRADFSNAETGQSKSVIGTDGEVHIPYEYFVPGATIHCWLVWSGEDYTVTRKHIMIPIARRATPTDEEPSPDEQGVIDQAIAALNDAVAQTGQDVEAAAGYAEQAEQSAQAATSAKDTAVAAQNAAEATKDQAVQSAANAAASAQSASESAQSASQSKTDAQAAAASVAGAMNTLEATIQADLQSAKESGEFDGADGVSPTVTVTPITDGHQVMITDADGEHTFDVTDGEPGADGFSPVATVTQTQTGATISITDKAGTTTAQISNGAKGDPGDDYVLTAQDKAEIAQQAAAEVDVPVQDVQVNGTSILENGVANVPVASTTKLGAVKINTNYGVVASPAGELLTYTAGDALIKAGSNQYRPIAPYFQHKAAFYGLAKAAGSDEKNSTLPVGQYTDEAKIAIQKMLGIYEAPWELIREDTFTNAEEADHIINVDGNGQAFELTDIVLQFETPRQETESKFGGSGGIIFYPNGYATFTCECGGYTQEANSSPHGCVVLVEQKGNAIHVFRALNTTTSNTGSLGMRYGEGFIAAETNGYVDRLGFSILSNIMTFSRINIRKITGTGHYKLYGKRKWQ